MKSEGVGAVVSGLINSRKVNKRDWNCPSGNAPPQGLQYCRMGVRLPYGAMEAFEQLKTHCCIAGGGPAGMMAAYLLARAGVQVMSFI